MNDFLKKFIIISILPTLILVLSNCGKHETTSGAVGTATGVAIGTAVAGKKDKGTGALLGGLIGNFVGREVGRDEDIREEREEQKEKVEKLESEKRYLKKQLDKWCMGCGKKVTISGAQSCPDCGDTLIREKFCGRCKTIFSPENRFKYCPYCKLKTSLSAR